MSKLFEGSIGAAEPSENAESANTEGPQEGTATSPIGNATTSTVTGGQATQSQSQLLNNTQTVTGLNLGTASAAAAANAAQSMRNNVTGANSSMLNNNVNTNSNIKTRSEREAEAGTGNVNKTEEQKKQENLKKRIMQTDGMTGLWRAVFDNDLEMLSEMLNQGASVHEVDELNRTPLVRACALGYLKIVSALIEAASDVQHDCQAALVTASS